MATAAAEATPPPTATAKERGFIFFPHAAFMLKSIKP